jgi:hypothetical protein
MGQLMELTSPTFNHTLVLLLEKLSGGPVHARILSRDRGQSHGHYLHFTRQTKFVSSVMAKNIKALQARRSE